MIKNSVNKDETLRDKRGNYKKTITWKRSKCNLKLNYLFLKLI